MDIEALLIEYKKLIWSIINKFVQNNNIPWDHVDDIYQETCIRLFQKLPTYDPKLSSTRTFVATNTDIACMRYRRDYFRSDMAPLDEIEKAHIEPPFEKMTQIIDSYETTDLNRKIIYQKMFGYTQQEIAKEFSLSQSTVSRILSTFGDFVLSGIKD